MPKPAVSEQRPSSPENVFSLMAKKIKSLELNQSMFDRYIESLSASYGGRFEDIAQEVNDLEELVANQTSALVELDKALDKATSCLLYTSPSPRDKRQSRMPSSA